MSSSDPSKSAGNTQVPQVGQEVRTAFGEKVGVVVDAADGGIVVDQGAPSPARRVIPADLITAVDEHGVHIWPSLEQLETDYPATESTGTSRASSTPAMAAGQARGAAGSDQPQTVVELAQERLVAHTDWQQTGEVRFRTVVENVPGEVDVQAAREKLVVERVPVDQVVDERRPAREEGDVLIIPIYEERLVVTKQLVLTEELHVTRVTETETQHFEDTLRRERLVVEDPDQTGAVEIHDHQGGLKDAIKKLLP